MVVVNNFVNVAVEKKQKLQQDFLKEVIERVVDAKDM